MQESRARVVVGGVADWVTSRADAAAAAVVSPARLSRIRPAALHRWLAFRVNDGLKDHPRTVRARLVCGCEIDVDTTDHLQRYAYLFGQWEPAVTRAARALLRPGDVVVDVGANIGYYSLIASCAVGQTGTVYAFEALPQVARTLAANVAGNALANVVALPVAVGDHAGTLVVRHPSGSNTLYGSASHHDEGWTEVTVPVDRLDALVPQAQWPRIRLVKIDVEGAELHVLAGMPGILAAMPPGAGLLVEVSTEWQGSTMTCAADFVEHMDGLGFDAHPLLNEYAIAEYLDADATADTDAAVVIDLSGDRADVLFVKR